MARFHSLAHLTDGVLLRNLAALVVQDRTITAAFLAHLAEVDARRLYVPAGFPSMYLYAVHKLRLSEDAALKRIQAARTARRFPATFDHLVEGRLHLSAVCLLAPYLTSENADELLNAAVHKTKSELEELLAARFPRSEVLPLATAIPSSRALCEGPHAPGQVEAPMPEHVGVTDPPGPPRVEALAPRPKLAPVAPERFLLQLTIGRDTHDKLRHAQELLSHQIPSGDLAGVLDRTLDIAIHQLEKRKFAATTKPRTSQTRSTPDSRHIPAEVKRAVWHRDGGQCTFVSAAGHRCPARTLLEFDHADPVALGGRATVDRVRLRCAPHNQYAAD